MTHSSPGSAALLAQREAALQQIADLAPEERTIRLDRAFSILREMASIARNELSALRPCAPAQAASTVEECARMAESHVGAANDPNYDEACRDIAKAIRDAFHEGTQPQAVSEFDVMLVAGRLRALGALKDDYGQTQHEWVREALRSLSRPERGGK